MDVGEGVVVVVVDVLVAALAVNNSAAVGMIPEVVSQIPEVNKPLQGMAPTECLLSAFVLDCFLACLPAHLLCLPSHLLLACLLACSPTCLPAHLSAHGSLEGRLRGKKVRSRNSGVVR